jgi:hypothetical protein
MINNAYYSWEHITIKIFGVTLYDIEEIKWGRKFPIQRRHGKGREARGFVRKRVSGAGEFKMAMEEWERLLKDPKLADKGIEEHDPFEITVQYDDGNNVVTKVLQDIVLTEENWDGIKEDSDGTMVTIPFEILGKVISQ